MQLFSNNEPSLVTYFKIDVNQKNDESSSTETQSVSTLDDHLNVETNSTLYGEQKNDCKDKNSSPISSTIVGGLSTADTSVEQDLRNASKLPTIYRINDKELFNKRSLKRINDCKTTLMNVFPTSNVHERKNEQSQTNENEKHFRLGLFYTWSFKEKRTRTKVNESEDSDQLDSMWLQAASSYPSLHTSYTSGTDDSLFSITNSRKAYSNQWYNSLPFKQTQHEYDDRCYSTDQRSFYKNVFPYTTMYKPMAHRYASVKYSTGRSNFDLPLVPYTSRQSKNSFLQTMPSEINNLTTPYPVDYTDNEFRVNILPRNTPCLFSPYTNTSESESQRSDNKLMNVFCCNGRNSIIGWVLAITAFLVFGLAVALFIQGIVHIKCFP